MNRSVKCQVEVHGTRDLAGLFEVDVDVDLITLFEWWIRSSM